MSSVLVPLTTLAATVLAQLGGAAVQQEAGAVPEPSGNPAVAQEPADPEIVVVGKPPRCRPRPDDPLDSVDLAAAAAGGQLVIKRDPATGEMRLFPDDDPVTGPEVWQRAGTRLDRYVFRVPDDGTPLCIGVPDGPSPGWGQLRQVHDATPYRGKIVRVTMWAGSRDAGRVWFWLASGREGKPGSGDADVAAESSDVEFRGTNKWTPVSLTMAVRCDQAKFSFGALLDGRGSLWLYQPKLEVLEDNSRAARRDCRRAEAHPPS